MKSIYFFILAILGSYGTVGLSQVGGREAMAKVVSMVGRASGERFAVPIYSDFLGKRLAGKPADRGVANFVAHKQNYIDSLMQTSNPLRVQEAMARLAEFSYLNYRFMLSEYEDVAPTDLKQEWEKASVPARWDMEIHSDIYKSLFASERFMREFSTSSMVRDAEVGTAEFLADYRKTLERDTTPLAEAEGEDPRDMTITELRMLSILLSSLKRDHPAETRQLFVLATLLEHSENPSLVGQEMALQRAVIFALQNKAEEMKNVAVDNDSSLISDNNYSKFRRLGSPGIREDVWRELYILQQNTGRDFGELLQTIELSE